MSGYNLVHQPWIPVLAGGARTEVSLLEAITRAHELDALGLDDPLQTVAILRQVLLPVVLDALGTPRSEAEWADRWAAGRIDPARVTDYLHTHAPRFDLFDQDAPFAQVADLRSGKGETKSTSVLLPAVATGNNVPLFSSRTDDTPPVLTPAQAARALLAAHCWDTAGIKTGAVGDPQVKAGKTTGNPTGPVGSLGVVIPVGATVAQTLLLNQPIIPQGLHPQDRPQWRADPATPAWTRRPALGLLDLLTFQSRRVRLIPDEATDATITVSRAVLAAGDRLDPHPMDEPHTMWRQQKTPKPGRPPLVPVRHQPGRSSWRGLSAMLAVTTPTQDGVTSSRLLDQIAALRADGRVSDRLPLQVLTVGAAYGTQSAVVDDVIVDLIPLPVLALAEDSPTRRLLDEVVEQAERLRRAGNTLGDEIRRAAGGDPLPWNQALRVGDALLFGLSPVVHRLLAGLQREPERLEDADAAWQAVARHSALEAGDAAIQAAPPQAFLGRAPTKGPAHRLSVAEASYRRTVNSILPLATDRVPVGGHV